MLVPLWYRPVQNMYYETHACPVVPSQMPCTVCWVSVACHAILTLGSCTQSGHSACMFHCAVVTWLWRALEFVFSLTVTVQSFLIRISVMVLKWVFMLPVSVPVFPSVLDVSSSTSDLVVLLSSETSTNKIADRKKSPGSSLLGLFKNFFFMREKRGKGEGQRLVFLTGSYHVVISYPSLGLQACTTVLAVQVDWETNLGWPSGF